MDTLKGIFFKPDPAEQARKCNHLMRANIRKLDADIRRLHVTEQKTKDLIRSSSRRAERTPQYATQATKDTRTFAIELIRCRRQIARLTTSKAQLGSVALQVQEAFAIRKIEGSLRASTGIMRDVNALVRLPELMGTMRELSVELMKAGIVEEEVGELLPVDSVEENEEVEVEGEVERVLAEVLRGRMEKGGVVPSVPVQEPVPIEEDEEEEDAEEMLSQMRGRLEALKS